MFGHSIRKHVLPRDPVSLNRPLLDLINDVVVGDIDMLDLRGV